MLTHCIFCGATVRLVHVHGHYQCPLCKTNALPCCDGDNCSNFFLATGGDMHEHPVASAGSEPVKSSTEPGRGIFLP